MMSSKQTKMTQQFYFEIKVICCIYLKLLKRYSLIILNNQVDIHSLVCFQYQMINHALSLDFDQEKGRLFIQQNFWLFFIKFFVQRDCLDQLCETVLKVILYKMVSDLLHLHFVQQNYSYEFCLVFAPCLYSSITYPIN